jgi:hypothetical protein
MMGGKEPKKGTSGNKPPLRTFLSLQVETWADGTVLELMPDGSKIQVSFCCIKAVLRRTCHS